jgi:AmmeMemoRadiSam system protein A
MVSEPVDRRISRVGRRFLLELARQTIADRLGLSAAAAPRPPDEVRSVQGAFVTLKIGDRLRGCIGHVVGVVPLWEAVRENALAAAFRDPRFPPLEGRELARVRFEISVLSPLRAVSSDEVEVGRHGVLIERGRSRGLLLPQVADEHGWDRDTFLDHTCRKAGLEPGCWRDRETEIQVFTAEVFGDDDL